MCACLVAPLCGFAWHARLLCLFAPSRARASKAASVTDVAAASDSQPMEATPAVAAAASAPASSAPAAAAAASSAAAAASDHDLSSSFPSQLAATDALLASELMAPVPAAQAASLLASLDRLLSNSLVELLEGLETLIVYTRNLILYPDEKKYRKIKITNIHYQERLGHLEGAEEAMQAIGYMPQGEYLRLDEKRLHAPDNSQMLKAVDQIAMTKLNQLKQQWAELPARTQPSHPYKCVQAVGSHSAIGKRHNMEDDEIMVDEFCGVETQGYFGLYDGEDDTDKHHARDCRVMS